MSAAFASSVGEAQTAARPLIILVHGRGQTDTSRANVRKHFIDALRAGERSVAGRSIVPDTDLAFVWYADAIAGQLQPGQGAERCRYAEAPETTEPLDWLKNGLLTIAQGAGLADDALRRFTTDTYNYFSKWEVRCNANVRIEALTNDPVNKGRPVIVAAHSMGGIVSFASLQSNASLISPSARLRVHRYVTFGTQVGAPIILRAIDGTYVTLPVPVPQTIASWLNFRNKNDALSFPTSGVFKASDSDRLPKDVAIDVPGPRHAVESYLGNSRVAIAILAPWCRGQAGGSRPTECNLIEAADVWP